MELPNVPEKTLLELLRYRWEDPLTTHLPKNDFYATLAA